MILSSRVRILAVTLTLITAPAFAGTYTVTTLADAGGGSLRQGVLDANSGLCTSPCVITFAPTVFAAPFQTISLLTEISVSAANVTIDGFSGGSTGTPNSNAFGAADNSQHRVIIRGPSTTCFCSAFNVFAAGFRLQGVVIQNFQTGVSINGSAAVITGTKFGTDNTGLLAPAGAANGTAITAGSGGMMTVGGPAPADRNIISNSTGAAGISIQGSATVLGNYIGVNAALSPLPNQQGILLSFLTGNKIGDAGVGNIISNNITNGIRTVSGGHQIAFNTIASNGQDGVALDGTMTGVNITQNSISSNGLLGIDLRNGSFSPPGPNANDPGDADSAAANNLQNFPVITSANVTSGTLTAVVNVDSSSVTTTGSLRVELFEADADPTNPEGARYLLPSSSQCFGGNSIVGGTITVPASGLVSGDRIVATVTSYQPFTTPCTLINDGTSEFSVAAAVVIVNTPPVANADSATTPEDTPVTISVLANDTDPDSNPLTVSGNTAPSQGTVTCTATNCTYTPNPNTSGADSFTYTISDGNGGTATATVTVTITPVNDPPVANADTLTTNEDTAGTVNVLANDTDVDTAPSGLAVTGNTNGTKGTVTCTTAGVCTYTPAANATGADSFTYTMSDGASVSNATVTVTITAVNDAPIANADTLTTNEDTPGSVNVLTNDSDVDGPAALTVTGSTNGSNGTVICTAAGGCTYTPNPNFSGTDSFTYNVFDGTATSIGTVNVTITAINDAPVANPDSLTTNEDTAGTVNVLSNDTDPDSTAALTVTGNSNGTKGTATCTAAGVCTYTPNLNANGTDTFTYTVSDGVASSTGVVNVTITPVNDPPVANPDTASTAAGTPVTKNVIANDSDPDGDPLTFSGSTNGANGSVLCTGTNCTYTPAAGFTGTDSFTYTITDGAGGSATTTVSVTVASVNAAPNATDDSASAFEGRTVNINVLANDSDPNGDPLTITSFTQGAKGTVTCTTFCSYRPNSGQSGSDSFTYKISDGKGGTASATVRISITPCPAAAAIFSPQDGATNVPTSGNLSFASGASDNTVYFGPVGSGCSTAYYLASGSQVPYSNLQPGTEYEWRVEGRQSGCPTVTSSCVRFRTASSCPAAPTPLQPAANATVQSPVTFTWTAVTGASNYRVFVSASGGPATEVGATTATTLTAVVPDGAIRWFVVATVAGCADLQSASVSFNVCNVAGQPLAGVVGESTSEQTYSVSWLNVTGATRYEVQEATNAAFTDVQTFSTQSTSVSFTKSATTARPFFYRVRAFSDCFGAFGPFSPTIRVVIVPVPPREDPDTDATVPVGSRRTVVLQVFVAGEPNQTLRYSATGDKPWMRVDPANGSLPPEGVTLNVSANPADLPNGTFTGTVIVTISDTSGARQSTHATTTKQVPVSINLVTPVLPIGSGTPPDTSLIIPAVGHLDGLDARWRSDVRIANTSGAKLRYQVSLVPADVNIGQKQTTIDIDAGATTALDDVVRAWYGVGSLGESSAGYLEIRPLPGQRSVGSPTVDADPPGISLATVVTSRTYSQTSAGTLGEFIPGIAFGNFIGRTAGNASPQVLNLQQIAQDSNFRTNVGLVEASGNAASALVSIYNSTGTKLRDVPVELRANEQRQLNSLLAQQNITLADGRIEVRVTGGEGKVTAYAAVVDNRSKDQLFVPPVALTNLLSSKYVVAGVADLVSGNAIWRSDLRVFNAGSAVQNATLTLYPQNNSGAPVTANASINPGEVRILNNIVQDLFRTSNLGGAVHVDTPSGSSLVVTGRTYTPTANGILGQFIEAVTPDEAVGSGERSLNILQAEDSVRYRTNLGLAEVTGKGAVVEVTITLPDSKVSPVVQIPLGANEFTQLGILRGLGIGNVYNARLSIRVVSGEGRVTAYGSLIDMKTQDSTYVPAR